jgi:hypothetical protein
MTNQAIIQLKPSTRIQGEIGVFAIRNLKMSTIVGDTKWLNEDCLYTWEQYRKLDRKTREVIARFCIHTEQGFHGPSNLNYFSIPWYINHSCEGNIGFDDAGNFVTIKYVRAGEELCYDYSFTGTRPINMSKCLCGLEKCRKKITGEEWRDPDYRKKNFRHFTPELKNLIRLEEGSR